MSDETLHSRPDSRDGGITNTAQSHTWLCCEGPDSFFSTFTFAKSASVVRLALLTAHGLSPQVSNGDLKLNFRSVVPAPPPVFCALSLMAWDTALECPRWSLSLYPAALTLGDIPPSCFSPTVCSQWAPCLHSAPESPEGSRPCQGQGPIFPGPAALPPPVPGWPLTTGHPPCHPCLQESVLSQHS